MTCTLIGLQQGLVGPVLSQLFSYQRSDGLSELFTVVRFFRSGLPQSACDKIVSVPRRESTLPKREVDLNRTVDRQLETAK